MKLRITPHQHKTCLQNLKFIVLNQCVYFAPYVCSERWTFSLLKRPPRVVESLAMTCVLRVMRKSANTRMGITKCAYKIGM